MASDLLESLVIKYLDDNAFHYSARDGFVEAVFSHDLKSHVRVVIVDQESSPPFLSFIVKDIARFPEARKAYAATMCNEFSRRAVGKFVIDEDGGVLYSFDLPVTAGSRPEDVELALDVAVSTVNDFMPAIMAALWANASVEDALARLDLDD